MKHDVHEWTHRVEDVHKWDAQSELRIIQDVQKKSLGEKYVT